MRNLALLIPAIAASLWLTTPASAAPPTHDVEDVIAEYTMPVPCAFPLLVEEDGRIRRTTFTDDDGQVTRIHESAPRFKTTITNTLTGESTIFASTGPRTITFHGDGSETRKGTGAWLWGLSEPQTGEPGLFILHGHWELHMDPAGQRTSTFVGRSVNLCELLAP